MYDQCSQQGSKHTPKVSICAGVSVVKDPTLMSIIVASGSTIACHTHIIADHHLLVKWYFVAKKQHKDPSEKSNTFVGLGQ